MKIKLRAFTNHDNTTVDIPEAGIVLVTGQNGAGKSTLVEAVSMAIWGKGLRGRWVPWRAGVKGFVQIEHGGLNVTRKWSGSTKQLTWSIDGTDVVNYDTQTKAQEALEAIAGTHEAWRRTSVFSASDAQHFTTATDAERKELLEELLGLSWFDRALAAARTDLRQARADREALTREQGLLGEKVAAMARLLERSPTDVGVVDVGDLRLETARIKRVKDEAQAEVDQVRRKISDASGTMLEYETELRLAQRHLGLVDKDVCPTCTQPISDKLKKNVKLAVETASHHVKTQRAAVEEAVVPLEAERVELVAELETLQDVYQKSFEKVRSIEQANQYAKAEAIKRGRADGELEVDRGRMAVAAERLAKTEIDVAELEAVEQVLGTRGVRAHLLSQTLDGIEALANVWLTRLRSKIVVEIRSYTEKKTGGTMDAISLGLVGVGGEHGYLGASAGERRRVDVAILLALAEIAGTSSGAGKMPARLPIFLDEIFDSLDETGVDAVIEVLRTLSEDRAVVLITHNAAIAEAVPAAMRLTVDDGTIVCSSR